MTDLAQIKSEIDRIMATDYDPKAISKIDAPDFCQCSTPTVICSHHGWSELTFMEPIWDWICEQLPALNDDFDDTPDHPAIIWESQLMNTVFYELPFSLQMKLQDVFHHDDGDVGPPEESEWYSERELDRMAMDSENRYMRHWM